MEKRKIARRLPILTFVALVCSGLASAQLSPTYVSGVGDDSNPCVRTAPCQTFAGALLKTAAGGEIDCLDPGEFDVLYNYGVNPPTSTPAPLTINKAITIDCGGGGARGQRRLGGLTAPGSTGITIAAGATDPVTIRNLSINGMGTAGTGIDVVSAGAVHIENVGIFNFMNAGVAFATSTHTLLRMNNVTITDSGAGVNASGYTGANGVIDLENIRVFGCAPAVLGGPNTLVNVVHSVLAANGSAIRQTTAFSQMNVSASALNSNGNAIRGNAGSQVRAYGNAMFQNGTGFNSSGGAIFTDGTNSPGGNGTNGVANGGALPKN